MKKSLFAIAYRHYACCISLLQRARMIVVIPTSVNIVHIMKPSPNDWGTCLCRTCLNPEIKLEALPKILNNTSFKWDDTNDYNDIKDLIKRIDQLKCEKLITFSEW